MNKTRLELINEIIQIRIKIYGSSYKLRDPKTLFKDKPKSWLKREIEYLTEIFNL